MWCLLMFLIFDLCKSAKILGAFPTPSVSHQVIFQPIWRELSLRGHQVTVLTPNPLKNSSLTNLTEIDMEFVYDMFRRDYIGDKMNKEKSGVDQFSWYYGQMEEITEGFFKKAESLLKDPKTEFDLIMVEIVHPLVYSLGCRFKVPVVGISSLTLFLQSHDAVGNPTHPVATPDVFSNIMGDIGLYQKICSVMHNIWYRIWYHWSVLPKNDKISKNYWGQDCPYLGDIERNVSLILVNTHPLLYQARPNVPNVIEIGQRNNNKKPLPQDLQKFLDASTQGVIYFSLGSNVRSSNLPSHTQKNIIQALSEIPYNVLWKLEDDIPDRPENVFTRKWFPQQDVLGHKNVKVFVTQGGIQSMEEAIMNCVPLVGIPVIADQPLNVLKMVKMGIGRSIDYTVMTKENLKEAIIDVAENERYKQKIREVKDIFFDQPMNGLEKSVWWIEYVLRHKGARHLRSDAADMSLFEYFLLDVVIVFLFILGTLYYLIILFVKILKQFVNKRCKTKTE